MQLGIGNNNVKFKINRNNQEIAYKLWVELSTRKIGLEFEPEYDVIIEVYNSWYAFGGTARDLLKEIPVEAIDKSDYLIKLTIDVLNKGLRPHLTRWQAKFRQWYKIERENDCLKPSQELQKEYPQYEELVKDLQETNPKMIYYCSLMKDIAFMK